MNNKTEVNYVIKSNKTSVNMVLNNNNNFTTVNSVLLQTNIANGILLNNKYKVISKMDITSGEADLYICEYLNQKFVAKIYRRDIAIKQDVIDLLKKIESQHIAPLYETGIYNGFPFDILPYYKHGSLQGKIFSFDELKENIIPSLNKGLYVLHENGLLHKDLKPSNIMFCDNGKDVAIIDFGISSVSKQEATVVVTQTGKTPEYSAPETFRNLFLVESDYFSLGITVYELFCGSTPFKNMSKEVIEQFSLIQRIPLPDNMPNELKDLIAGLTYYDITNRNNENNPNRRFTYHETCKWCNGEKLIIPGEGINISKYVIPSYIFLDKKYTDISELISVLGLNWNEGKKELFKGSIAGFFKAFNLQLADFCIDAEEEANKGANEDFVFWKLLYKLNSDSKVFYWKGECFKTLQALGNSILENLRDNDEKQFDFYDSVLKTRLLSSYIKQVNPKDISQVKAAESLENFWIYECKTERDKMIHLYTVGYTLSGQKVLCIDWVKFRTIDELSEYMTQLLKKSYDEFEEFCHRMIDYDNNLDVQLESWLLALGKRKELEQWRENLRR